VGRDGRQWHNGGRETPRMRNSTETIRDNYEAADSREAQMMAVVGEARDGG
jgi:hypothetical protein